MLLILIYFIPSKPSSSSSLQHTPRFVSDVRALSPKRAEDLFVLFLMNRGYYCMYGTTYRTCTCLT